MILAGMLLKLGGYGFIKVVLRLFRMASLKFSRFMLLLSILGVVYTSLTTIRQADLKRVIAYASIGHMSVSIAGLFSLNAYGIVGSYLL